MIYCSLGNRGTTTLSVSGLITAKTKNPGGDFAYAIEHPIEGVPVSSVAVESKIPAFANQGAWLGSAELSGKDSAVIPGLISCAAVLFYDAGLKLIGAGHPGGGFIDDTVLQTIMCMVDVDSVHYIVYATPDFAGDTTGSYADSVNILTQKWDTSDICIVDGFGKRGGTVIADMTGSFILQ